MMLLWARQGLVVSALRKSNRERERWRQYMHPSDAPVTCKWLFLGVLSIFFHMILSTCLSPVLLSMTGRRNPRTFVFVLFVWSGLSAVAETASVSASPLHPSRSCYRRLWLSFAQTIYICPVGRQVHLVIRSTWN